MNNIALPGWLVIEVEETVHKVRVTAEPVKKILRCPHCDSDKLERSGKRAQMYVDIPVRGKPVTLIVSRQRYRCKSCNRIIQESLPGIDERRKATERLVRYIEEEALKRTFTSIGKEVWLDEKSIRRIFGERIKRKEEAVQFKTPEWLGVDEFNLGRTARLILTNIKYETIFEVYPSPADGHLQSALENLPDKQKVRVVAMNMRKSYKKIVEEILPSAQVAINKFYVLHRVKEVLDDVRKSIQESLPEGERRRLMRHRFLLQTRKRKLGEKGRTEVENLFAWHPLLESAYELNELFHEFYTIRDKSRATQFYEVMLKPTLSKLAGFNEKVNEKVKELRGWREEILNYLNYEVKNTFIEAVEGITGEVGSGRRDYSFTAVRSKILHETSYKTMSFPQRQSKPSRKMSGGAKKSNIEKVNFGVPVSAFIKMLKKGGI